jgi:MFS superfamily sulfate permease-like transporter
MKNTLFIIACLSISAAVAQPEVKREKKTPEERAEIMTSRMKKNLDLSDKQVAEVKVQNLSFFQKQEAHQQELKAIQEKGKQIRNEHFDNLKSILTPEQQEKAKELMDERKAKRKNRRNKRRK